MRMKVNDIKLVKPSKDNVVVKNIEPDKASELFIDKSNGTDLRNAPMAVGKIIAAGPRVCANCKHLGIDCDENCPGLKAGNIVVHNAFAGSYIATDELSGLYKIMSGYSISAVLGDISNLNENTIHPTANRILVAVKFTDETDTGLFISADEAKDPKLSDLDYGTIVKVGPSCNLGYKVGDIVAYQPYAGENIRSAESVKKPALRVLIEEDVLLTI